MPRRFIVSLSSVAVLCLAASAQQPPPQPPPPPQHSPPPATAIAATVNGAQITELAVFRGLIGVSSDKRDELRGEVLNYLIENALLDEYLDQMKVDVEAKDIDAHVAKLKTEIEAKGQKLEDVYKQLVITEADLRTQIRATLRWEKFIQQYATEKAVKDFFDGNKAIFDGSAVHAKHILIGVPPGSVQAAEDAKARVLLLKQQIETQVTQQLAAAGNQDNLKLQKMRMELFEASFAAVATKESTCPTKSSGGDLGWFPRAGGGRVTEAFAKEAF
ncbi:MAG TPA: peptidylprolyl isomerase, partial [Gemmataceae bacterium]|nr:peptidylprolyl isomerase [Gemmataceae bacterium]